jgi:hypothetical protein
MIVPAIPVVPCIRRGLDRDILPVFLRQLRDEFYSPIPLGIAREFQTLAPLLRNRQPAYPVTEFVRRIHARRRIVNLLGDPKRRPEVEALLRLIPIQHRRHACRRFEHEVTITRQGFSRGRVAIQ